MGAEVNIPDEAIRRAAVSLSNYEYARLSEREQAHLRCQSDAALRGGAPLIVATELSRLLEAARPDEETLSVLVEARASELRGED